MATYETNVQRAFSSQGTLIDREEHCSADPEQLATIGRAQGHQIRVWRNGSEAVALYTVSEVREEAPGTIVRMARAARARLTPEASETPDEFAAIVDSQVPHPTYTDEEAATAGEFVERLSDDGGHTGLVAIAPHGGAIEPGTDREAERVAGQLTAQGVSYWLCKGWSTTDRAYDQWHATSAALHPASFPLLASIVARGFTYAVAFHGFSDNDILIGGGVGDALKQEVQAAIQSAIAGSGIEVRIATASDNFNGDDPNNIVNRLANGNGLQIEQCREARDDYWQKIADAVSGVYESKIELQGTGEC
jgi:phage replication-related protein YjqB (UPF0714/DUF867 family)